LNDTSIKALYLDGNVWVLLVVHVLCTGPVLGIQCLTLFLILTVVQLIHVAAELDLVMATVSLDMTGLIVIGVNYKESSYAPHARAADVILAEEEEHELFASNVLRDAAERLGAEAVNGALREWLPRAVNFFGPPGSGFTFDCIRYGLKTRDNRELADLYLSLLERRVLHAGLDLPSLSNDYPHALA